MAIVATQLITARLVVRVNSVSVAGPAATGTEDPKMIMTEEFLLISHAGRRGPANTVISVQQACAVLSSESPCMSFFSRFILKRRPSGYCGDSADYCSSGCQAAFGNCTTGSGGSVNGTSDDGRCGPDNGNTVCGATECCSASG